jgi:putative redox protein
MGELPSQEPRSVVVSGPATGFRTEVEVGGHRLVVDEPIAVGGADHGPTPYEMLLAGLGACTAMTLRLYADRRKWPLERARISLQHRKVHAQDCVDCVTKPAKMDVVDRILHLEGPLTDEQKAKLLEIAERCPVHQTLQSKIQVNTRVA